MISSSRLNSLFVVHGLAGICSPSKFMRFTWRRSRMSPR